MSDISSGKTSADGNLAKRVQILGIFSERF